MRILMISDVYFPRINGVSTSIQTFRRGLHAAGHETFLIAPEYPGGKSADEEGILRVPSRGVPRDPEDRAMKLGAIRALRPQLERLEPDLVHIQTPFIAHYQGTALARALRVPVIESYHTYFEEYLHHYVPLMPRALMRFIARSSGSRGTPREGTRRMPLSVSAAAPGYSGAIRIVSWPAACRPRRKV